jgi:hypothetical protein
MRKHAPRMRVLRKRPPPTAIPAIAAPVIFTDELEDGAAEVAALCVATGIARVAVRDAMDAFWVKYTLRSLLSKPFTGAVAVAPPVDLRALAGSMEYPNDNLRAANSRNDLGWQNIICEIKRISIPLSS